MSHITNDNKRLKLQDDKQDYPQTLHNMCNWLYLNKIAIEYCDIKEKKIINYNELRAMKDIISNYLKCIRHPEFIGIDLDILEYCIPSLMLGILDSGHAFFNVPADPQTYKHMLTFLHVNYMFTKYVVSNREIICKFDIHGQPIYLTKIIDVQEKNTNGRWYHFAYAIATSGSTGVPKIVKIPHSCILPNITDLRRILYVTNSDKIAQLTNFTFDPSIVEIFLSLFCAATLFMVSKLLKNDADRLLEEMLHCHVTFLQITPSLLFYKWSSERLKTTILNKNSQLRILLLGGEPFPSMKSILKSSHSQNMTRIFNIYGITEISCWSSINEIAKDNSIDESYLGEPLSETIFQIKNENNEVITRGEGTLYIGSINRICTMENETDEDLTKPIFYKTDDIVSVNNEGRIFYKGRRNNIIKRFGNKVNLRELEKIAMELNFVRNCVTFWDTKSHKLYLCISTTKPKEEFSKLKEETMSHLKILPEIYKPDKIIITDNFNFTSSGKICHVSLKKICQESETEIVINDLSADVGEVFRNLWNNHVKSKGIGFLTSGGTSIAALQISNAAAEAFKAEFPELIGMLFKDVTCNECVNYIIDTLIKKDCDKKVSQRVDISFAGKSSQEIFNTEESVTRQLSSDNSSSFLNKENFPQWYKCRGQTYSNMLIQEECIGPSQEENILSIKVLATYNLQKCIDASPTVYRYSKTELYTTVGSHFGIICTVDLLGRINKSYEIKLPDRIEASVLILPEFRGIVGCYDGYVYCIHLKTGEIIWKFQTQDMVKCTAITCAQGNKIFLGSYDHYVYCLSIKDGTQIWKTEASKSGICATGCLHKKSTSVLFGTLDGSCLAIQQSSGQIMWKRKLRDPIFVAPVVLRNGYVLFCSVAGTLCCFDIETNCQMWRYAIHGNVFSYPVIWNVESTNNEYVILASHNKHVYCLELSRKMTEENELKLKYTLQLSTPIFATPWCEDGRMFVACTDGTLKVFDLSEGKLLTSKQLPGETFSSPVVHDDLIVLGCRDNNLYILKLCAK